MPFRRSSAATWWDGDELRVFRTDEPRVIEDGDYEGEFILDVVARQRREAAKEASDE